MVCFPQEAKFGEINISCIDSCAFFSHFVDKDCISYQNLTTQNLLKLQGRHSNVEKSHIKGHIQVTSLCCLQAVRDRNSGLQSVISWQKWDGVSQDEEMRPPSVFPSAEFQRFPVSD